jgi:hypothetical protein
MEEVTGCSHDPPVDGDGLPDRVFDHNPEADDQLGFFVYLNTGDGFDNGTQWQSYGVTDWAIFPITITT